MNSPEREAWLAARRNYLTASDCAAVLGQSKWKTPFEVWAEKTGAVEPDNMDDNEPAEWGNRLERVIGEAFAEKTGRTVDFPPPYTLVVHPEHSWLGATPDAYQTARQDENILSRGIVQIKTASAFKAKDWEGDQPLDYQIQTNVEMAVTGAGWASLACLIGGQKFRYRDMLRNQKFIDLMIPRLKAFWDMVQTKTPPPADHSDSCLKTIAKLFPEDKGGIIQLPDEFLKIDEDLKACKEEIANLEKIKAGLTNQIKLAMGDNSIGMLPNAAGSYTYKTVDKEEYIVKASSSRQLRRGK